MSRAETGNGCNPGPRRGMRLKENNLIKTCCSLPSGSNNQRSVHIRAGGDGLARSRTYHKPNPPPVTAVSGDILKRARREGAYPFHGAPVEGTFDRRTYPRHGHTRYGVGRIFTGLKATGNLRPDKRLGAGDWGPNGWAVGLRWRSRWMLTRGTPTIPRQTSLIPHQDD